MPIYRLQNRMPQTTNVPADDVTNTTHVNATNDTIAMACAEHFANLFVNLSSYLSSTLVRTAGACQVEAFDLSDPEPRVPVGAHTYTLASSASTNVPNEVAVCLSHHAALVSGAHPGRRRGRIYFGPITTAAQQVTAGYPEVGNTFRAAAVAQMELFRSQCLGSGGSWQVYSRVDGAGFDVVGGWVDNEFDTQRRRGRRSTSRVLWP